jgi:hypothetical protein
LDGNFCISSNASFLREERLGRSSSRSRNTDAWHQKSPVEPHYRLTGAATDWTPSSLATFPWLNSCTLLGERGMVEVRCWHMPGSCYVLQLPMSSCARAHSSPLQVLRVVQTFLGCNSAARPHWGSGEQEHTGRIDILETLRYLLPSLHSLSKDGSCAVGSSEASGCRHSEECSSLAHGHRAELCESKVVVGQLSTAYYRYTVTGLAGAPSR